MGCPKSQLKETNVMMKYGCLYVAIEADDRDMENAQK